MAGKLAELEDIPRLDAQISDLAALKNLEISGIPTIRGSYASYEWGCKNQEKNKTKNTLILYNFSSTTNFFKVA